MPDLDIDRVEALAKAATPGPWGWFGHRDHGGMYLATQYGGRVYVMGFARHGMNSAQPTFQQYAADETRPGSGRMVKGQEVAILEVAPMDYRDDIVGFDNQDARFIAEVSPDVVLELVQRLRNAEKRIQLARGALVHLGYFTAEEVGDDIAPRIIEQWSAFEHKPRKGA